MAKTLEEIAEACGTESVAEAILAGRIQPEDFESSIRRDAVIQVRTGIELLETTLEDYLP